MKNLKLGAVSLAVATMAAVPSLAQATVIAPPASVVPAQHVSDHVTEVRWRGHHHRWHRHHGYGRHRHHHRYGRDLAIGLGLGIAGAIAGSRAYGYADDDRARCAAQYRSFEWDTGLYTTYGGDKRLCPYLR